MKFLVLHGFRENAQRASSKFKSWEKTIPNSQWKYLDGPMQYEKLDSKEELTEEEKTLKQWWRTDRSILHHDKEMKGLDMSIEYLDKAIADFQPDILIGFSQGASLLIIHNVKRQTKIPMVLVAPFLPEWLIQEWQTQKISSSIPVMVCIGENDTLVSPEQSIGATSLFEFGGLHHHPHGHVVPTRSRDKQAFVSFVNNWIM